MLFNVKRTKPVATKKVLNNKPNKRLVLGTIK